MRIPSSIVLFALSASAVAFGQQDGPYQVGYAVNLPVGDTVINITNDGAESIFNSECSSARGGVSAKCEGGAVPGPTLNSISKRPYEFRTPKRQQKSMFIVNGGGNPTQANICVNTYVFDPEEEEIGCCACLITPNGLYSFSVNSDLISNDLTPAIPTSAIIKLVGNMPGLDPANNFTLCNPATVDPNTLEFGAMAWGATLEPNGTGGYSVVSFPFLQGNLSTINNNTGNGSTDELTALTQTCAFIESNGSGYGICKSCRTGALNGTKR